MIYGDWVGQWDLLGERYTIFFFLFKYILKYKYIYMKRQYVGSNGSVAFTTMFISQQSQQQT